MAGDSYRRGRERLDAGEAPIPFFARFESLRITHDPVAVKPTSGPGKVVSAATLEAEVVESAIRDANRLAGPYMNKESRDWPGALAVYRRALVEAPESAKLRQSYASALAADGDLGASVEQWQKAFALEKPSAFNLNALAWELCLAGRYDEALPHARAARGHDSFAAVNIVDTLAHAEFGTGHWAEAVTAWSEVLKRDPGYFRDRTHNTCAEDQAHFAEAERRAARLRPDWAIRRTDALATARAWDAAIQAYRSTLDAGHDSAATRAKLAASLVATGDLGSAVVEGRRAVALDGGNPAYRKNLSRWLVSAGRYEEALPDARESARLLPADRDALDTLAHAAYATRRWGEAARAWGAIDRSVTNGLGSLVRAGCAEDRVRYEDAIRRAKEPSLTIPENPFAGSP